MFHHLDHLGKAIETRPLHRPQWMLLEERGDFCQLLQSPDTEFLSITMVCSDLTATEEFAESLQDRDVPLMLYHAELRKDLPAYLHRGLPIDADEETPFPVDESDNPLGTQPFLLVVCTGRIFTRVMSTAGYTRVSSIWPDAFADITGSVGSRSNLRTVIVHLVPMSP